MVAKRYNPEKIEALLRRVEIGRAGEADGTDYELAQAVRESAVEERTVEDLYYELLYAVGHKYPGETRHETALRYLRAAEQPSNEEASDKAHDAPAPGEEGA